MAQKLSDLQAQLRKGPVAPKGAPSSAPKEGLKRPADGQGGPPKKRVAAAKAAIVKLPGAGKGKSAPGLSAKMGGAPPSAAELPEDSLPMTTAKSSAPVPFQKAPMAQVSAPPAKRGEKRPNFSAAVAADASPAPLDNSLMPVTIEELVSAIEASTPNAKQRHAVQLGEAVGQTLPIEHINMFLRALKVKIVERAQTDGVQVQTPRAVASPGGADPALSKASTMVKSPGLPNSAPKSGAATPKATPSGQPPAGKVVMAKATLSKSAGIIAKVGLGSPAGTPPTVPPKAVVAKVPATVPVKAAPAKAKAAPAEELAPESVSKASPPASPPQEDALYQLVGELTDDPVVQDGLILEDRINEVFRRLWESVARRPKDWVAAWQAMGIPADRQGEALQKLLNIAFVQTEDPDKAPLILAELVKCHKIKMRSIEDVFVAFGQNLDGILAINEDAWQVYAKFLAFVFPKPAIEGWGWSRVGWDWKGWWQFAERCIQSLESSRAFDVLGLVLRMLEDKEGQPLFNIQIWSDGDRFAKFLGKLCDLGGCELPEVVERLSLLGVTAAEE